MDAAASYHHMLSSLAKNATETGEQHFEPGKSRLKKALDDLNLLLKWLDYQSHDLFDENRMLLQALITGLIADEAVNCDTVETVGLSIQGNLDNVPLSEASIKSSKKAITLATLKPSVAIGKDHVVIDPIVLFTRLIVLIQRTNNICGYFAYELAPTSTSLFKDSMMRKLSKSALAKALVKKVQTYVQDNGSDTGSDTDNASVVSLSTCEEVTEKEGETQERSRNTSHSANLMLLTEVNYFKE